MFDTFILTFASTISSIPFSAATWFVLATMVFFVWLFAKADRDPKSPIIWEHLIIDSCNNRASPYKMGYLVGLIVATWIVVTASDKDKLTLDIFGAYLTYLLGGAGANIMAKKDKAPTPEETSPEDTPPAR